MRRIAPFVALCLVAAALAADDGVESAREVPWDDAARTVFDPAWIVPELRTDPEARADRKPVDLAKRLKDLAARTFTAPEGVPGATSLTFGDLIAACRSFGDDAAGRDAYLDAMKAARPDVWRACGVELLQLGRDEFLRGPKWKPSKDHDRDGILHARPYRIDCDGTEPWTKIDASRSCQQGATVFFADLEAIKEAENDYTAYPSNVNASYDWIRALPGTFVKGKDPKGRPFDALRIEFRCDLPFPYTHYDCDLHILNRVGDDGLVRSDVYSTSEDFHWMAGQDLFVPLATTTGEFAGLVLARVFGFDLDGVPDGDDDVQEALRSSLGNLKRRSEKLFRDAGSKPRTLRGSLPAVTVRGVKKAG